MLTIEDCIALLERRRWRSTATVPIIEFHNAWDEKFLGDVQGYISQGKPISTGQGTLALKIIRKYREHLLAEVDVAQLDQLIAHPVYRREPYESVQMPREVRWVGGSRLAFRCKYNPTVTEDIKKLVGRGAFTAENGVHYMKEHKLWLVDVDDKNLERTMDVIKRHNFAYDAEVEQFFLNAHNCLLQPSAAGVDGEQILVVVQDNAFVDCLLQELSWLNPHA